MWKKEFNDRERWTNLKQLLSVTFFGVMTYAIFLPNSLVIGNGDDFTVDYYQVLPVTLVVGVIMFSLILLIGFILLALRWQKVFCVYKNLIFGLALGFYIQVNFLNTNLGVLDGRNFTWSWNDPDVFVSVVAWFLCLFIPLSFFLLKYDKWDVVRGYISNFLAAVQLFSLVFLSVTAKSTIESRMILTTSREFEMATTDNIVVFVVDTLDAEWAEKYIIADESNQDILKDFVYFDNVVAGGAPTLLGVPTLLTGVSYDSPVSMSVDEYYREAYASSDFFVDLKENGYTVDLYTDASLLKHADTENIDNVVLGITHNISSIRGFTMCLYKLANYCVMPYPLKGYFSFYGGDFSSYIEVRGYDKYRIDDPRFYRDFQEQHLSLGTTEKKFKLYHLFGTHAPFRMDENCNYTPDVSVTLEQQIKGTFKIIKEYIYEMKELGLYENSTIIITGDHGGIALEQNPAVFIKKANYSADELEISSAPAMFKNVRASMAAAFMDDYSSYGASLFDDMSDNLEKGRYHTVNFSLPADQYLNGRKKRDYERFSVGDPARDTEQLLEATED